MIGRLFEFCHWLTQVYCGARGHRWCGAPTINCSRCGAIA